LIADRRQRLRGRLLEIHDPAELRQARGRRQHRIAVDIAARGERSAVGRDQGGDLGQCGEVAPDIRALGGSGQRLAMGIDDIGRGRLADLRIAKEIGEEARIDVGDGDAVVEAGMRH
jgi:hypothetical protein